MTLGCRPATVAPCGEHGRPGEGSTRALAATVVAVVVLALAGAGGAAQPNSTLTPGATNPAVTQATVTTTVCRPRYSSTTRNVSTATTSHVYAEYGIAASQKRLYVIDHLVPLEVGGANEISNLWPQAKAEAKVKDELENLEHTKLCDGAIDLATAQQAFLAGVSVALVPAPAETAPGPETAAPRTEAPVAPGSGHTALCNDGSYSDAEHHQGACSRHGGVAQFYR